MCTKHRQIQTQTLTQTETQIHAQTQAQRDMRGSIFLPLSCRYGSYSAYVRSICGIAYLHQRLVKVERRRGEDGRGRSEEGSESRRGEVDDRRSGIVGYQDHIYSFQSV